MLRPVPIEKQLAIYVFSLAKATVALQEENATVQQKLCRLTDEDKTTKAKFTEMDDIRAAINKRFDDLPAELIQSPPIKLLKEQILKDVAAMIAEAAKQQP